MWPGYSTYTCWQRLLASTKRQSKDHQILSELYTNQMSNKFVELMDDTQRVYRKVSCGIRWAVLGWEMLLYKEKNRWEALAEERV